MDFSLLYINNFGLIEVENLTKTIPCNTKNVNSNF